MMAINLSIPDEVAMAIKWPRKQLDSQLAIELAFALYGRGLISMGSARRLAKLDKWAFLEGLAERQIERHYGEHELEEDIEYAKTGSE
jgi:predicted HTH domain antitoxin